MAAAKEAMDEIPGAVWMFVAVIPETGEMALGCQGCPHTNVLLISAATVHNDGLLLDHVCGEEHDHRRN